jgi:hypothetical protein
MKGNRDGAQRDRQDKGRDPKHKRLFDPADSPDLPREIDVYRRRAKERLRSKGQRPARTPARKRLVKA